MNLMKWIRGDKVEKLLSESPGLSKDEREQLEFQITRSMIDRERVERLLDAAPRGESGSQLADIFGGRMVDETR